MQRAHSSSVRLFWVLGLAGLLGGSVATSATYEHETIETFGDVGRWSSMALNSQGDPAVSYLGRNAMVCAMRKGHRWAIEIVDTKFDAGWYCD